MILNNNRMVELKDKYPNLMSHCQDISAGDGWLHLVEQVCRHIITNYPDKDIKITCIKEKFGCLRVYYSALGLSYPESDDIAEVVSLAESISMSTCEACGIRGADRRIMRNWVKTFCAKCNVDNRE